MRMSGDHMQTTTGKRQSLRDQLSQPARADEEQALRKLLIEKYGKPSQAGKGETVFLEKGVALRTGPHSVVFFSDRLKGKYGSF